MVPSDYGGDSQRSSGFWRAHFEKWFKRWEAVWVVSKLGTAHLELKEVGKGERRSDRGPPMVHEDEKVSWVTILAGAARASIGADHASQSRREVEVSWRKGGAAVERPKKRPSGRRGYAIRVAPRSRSGRFTSFLGQIGEPRLKAPSWHPCRWRYSSEEGKVTELQWLRRVDRV